MFEKELEIKLACALLHGLPLTNRECLAYWLPFLRTRQHEAHTAT
jgi:hypothetical protein